MEDLGDLCGLDYNTAYFMKYGRNAPVLKKETQNCFYDDFMKESLAKEEYFKQDEFHCWQGARLPQWIY
jgi:hypothetical protein